MIYNGFHIESIIQIIMLHTKTKLSILIKYLHHFHAGLLIAEGEAPYNAGFSLKPITLEVPPFIWGDCWWIGFWCNIGEFLLGILMSGLPPDRCSGSDLVDIAKLKKLKIFNIFSLLLRLNCTPCINIIYVTQYSYFWFFHDPS